MSNTVCGIKCGGCGFKSTCNGCAATNGHPFGGDCVLAACCQSKGYQRCESCTDIPCSLKKQLIAEFNALGVEGMDEVTELYALSGAFVNLEYTLPSGQTIKFWDDNRIYLGSQICKHDGSGRCFGLTADENCLLVCEYGDNGCDPEIIVYKKRGNT